jgi:hypothetical protein
MKDLVKVKKIITHSGKFHTDDVMSTVFLLKMKPDLEVIRIDEYETDDFNEEELVFDIGGGMFDHHGPEREINDYGHPFSSFGKLWRAYGREFLKNYGFTNVEKAYNLFYDYYVSKIDLGDNNGYINVKPRFFENELILTGTIGTADKPVVMWKDYLELKENGITIADTETAAIEYICRANEVECVVIKGISDFPKNEAETSNEDSHEEQLNTFLENIPKIMTKIFDEYLVYALRCNINYKEYESKPTTIRK